MKFNVKAISAIAILVCSSILIPQANATIVQFQTTQGDFEVNLFDNVTPKTVENFLTYISQGKYQDVIIHRSVPNFVIQAGGFSYSFLDETTEVITQNAMVINEPHLSNIRGTLAMAKTANNPNSATSQWFFNLADNTSLDTQNQGFTVFGMVLNDGMEVVDKIADLPIISGQAPFSDVPTQNMSDEDFQDPNFVFTGDNFVLINDIIITNDTKETHSELLDLIPQQESPDNDEDSDTSGGGTSWLFSLLVILGLVSRFRK